METLIARWGNSLGLRIPKGIASDAGLKAGDTVCIATSQDGIVIKRTRQRPKYSIEELVNQITEENRHPATNWGEPRGREIW